MEASVPDALEFQVRSPSSKLSERETRGGSRVGTSTYSGLHVADYVIQQGQVGPGEPAL